MIGCNGHVIILLVFMVINTYGNEDGRKCRVFGNIVLGSTLFLHTVGLILQIVTIGNGGAKFLNNFVVAPNFE